MPQRKMNIAEIRARNAGRSRKTSVGRIREGIQIFDCSVFSQERCSEGKFLDEYMNILNHQRQASRPRQKPVWHKRYLVRSPTGGGSDLQTLIRYAYYSTIHISAHGPPDEYKGPTYLMVGNREFTIDDLKGIWSKREEKGEEKPLLVFLSACHAGHKDLIKAFAAEGCKFCIAPVLGTPWEKAALFSALFYTYLFYGPYGSKYKPMEIRPAFEKAKKSLPNLTGNWKIFVDGDEAPKLALGYVTSP